MLNMLIFEVVLGLFLYICESKRQSELKTQEHEETLTVNHTVSKFCCASLRAACSRRPRLGLRLRRP